MAEKPTTLPEWATDPGAEVQEPSLGSKQTGWEVGKRPPAGWFNWWQELVYNWMQYLNAPVGTGAGAGIAATGGSTSGPGLEGTGGAPNGNGLKGNATGTGYGVLGVASANVASRGGSFSTAVDTALGGYGTNTFATQGTGSGLYGEGIASYGVTAKGHASGGASGRAALRVIPQNADPTGHQKGDLYTHSTNGLLNGSNGTSFLHYVAQLFSLTSVSDTLAGNLITAGAFFQLSATDIKATIPASGVRAGSVLTWSAAGNFALDNDASPNPLTVEVFLGAQRLGIIIAAMTQNETGTWNMRGTSTFRNTGAAAVVSSENGGGMTIDTPTPTIINYRSAENVTVDATAALDIKVKITMSNADAGDSFFLQNFVVSIT